MRTYASVLGLAFISTVGVPSAQAGEIYGPSYVNVNWTGLYAGVNGGYGWSASSSSLYAYASDAAAAESNTSPKASIDKNGGFGGGQIGYNYEMHRLVLGVEADIQDASMRGGASATTKAGAVVADAYREGSLDWFGTVRGRLGYSFDHTLIYFTGGFAYGGSTASSSITLDESANGVGIFNYSPTATGTRTGYVWGGGLEYALSHDWSVKAEYQYFDLGSSSGYFGYHIYPGGLESIARGYVSTERGYNTARTGLNYHISQDNKPLN